MTIPTLDFGRTGHQSTRLIFGAAALMRGDEAAAASALELLLEFGINHIDVAAGYGRAEASVGSWMPEHRKRFFLATKTSERTRDGAREQLERSLERLQTDRVDLIQLHNLTDEEGWETAFGVGGAVEALLDARDEGLVRFVGVTGHGSRVARMHLRSLERHAFDSVLLPYNFAMMEQVEYRESFEQLASVCAERGVAIQTIKSIAQRRWLTSEDPSTTTWYRPLVEPGHIECAVHWALSRPGIFVNSASSLDLLPVVLAAAAGFDAKRGPDDVGMAEIGASLDVRPLFGPGEDGIGREA